MKRAKLNDLTPDSRNANRGTLRGRKALEASLRQHGAGRSVLIDKEGRIIAGNKTVETAADLGFEDVIIVESDGKTLVAVQRTDLDLETDPEARLLAYADNRVGELDLDFDTDQMADDIAAGLDLSDLWDEAELQGMGARPKPTKSARPEIKGSDELVAKWGVELGQIWQLGRHRVACGSATDAALIRRLLQHKVPALMVTDLPYGVQYDAAWREAATGSNRTRGGASSILNDDRPSWSMAFRLFGGDVAYVWHAASYGPEVERSLQVVKFGIRAEIIWVKPHFALSRGSYHWRHESCFYAVRQGGKANWRGGRKQNTVWADIVDTWLPQDQLWACQVDENTLLAFDADMTTVWDIAPDPKGEGDWAQHPTQKPVECMARPIRNHGNRGDIVYDPFAGSGSTIWACEQEGRQARAVELDPAWVAVILEHWSQEAGEEPKLVR